MENRRIDREPTPAWNGVTSQVVATGSEGSPGRPPERTDSIFFVQGWAAGASWVEAWASRGGSIVLDHSAYLDVCRGLDFDPWQVLWCDPSDTDTVLAMLAELRGRSEKQEILVVRRFSDRVALESAGFASLRALCGNYRATLLVVIQQP